MNATRIRRTPTISRTICWLRLTCVVALLSKKNEINKKIISTRTTATIKRLPILFDFKFDLCWLLPY